MGTSFFGINERETTTTPYGTHPVRVRLHDDADDDFDDPRNLSVAGGNFAALSALLGLVSDDGECGDMTIAEARRAVMRARATFERKAPGLVREPSTEYGAPRTREDGSIELRPVRAVSGGLDLARLEGYVERFDALVQGLEARGATRIAWA